MMIRIDPAIHMERISGIIQSRYLPVVFFMFAIGMGLPVMRMIFDFLIAAAVYVFPLYLLFTLVTNDKKGWAAGLIVWMGISFLPLLTDIQSGYRQLLAGYLPFLFLILFCIALNFKLKDWGYRQTGGSPLWH